MIAAAAIAAVCAANVFVLSLARAAARGEGENPAGDRFSFSSPA